MVPSYYLTYSNFLMRSESAVSQIRTSDSSAALSLASVKEYHALQEFVSNVTKSCSQVEDGAGQQTLQLVTFLERIRDKTWADIKGALSA